MNNALKRYYLDDDKLGQLAWLEFARAMRTHRVIAFVGSMATEAFGYGQWKDFRKSFFDIALRVVADYAGGKWRPSDGQVASEANGQIRSIDQAAKSGNVNVADPVAMSLVEEILTRHEFEISRPTESDNKKHRWPLDHFDTPAEYLSHEFALLYRRLGVGRTPSKNLRHLDIPKLLFDSLDIRRFATTNYDFEIERKTMLRDFPDLEKNGSPTSPFDHLRELRERASASRGSEEFGWDLGSGRIRRVLTHGKAAESDLLNRERIDRLIEFAVGADDVDSHVMHLHGRACNWRSMIVTHRDYDTLYRRNDLNRLPFEFGRRLMMGGNPILFVGLGMTEEDINRDFREFISNNPYHRAPAFLLWSSLPKLLTPAERKVKRLDWLHRLGILTIFDDDLGFGPCQKEILERKTRQRDVVPGPPADPSPLDDDLRSLALLIEAVGTKLSLPLREDHCGTAWRSTNAARRPPEEHYPLILWGRHQMQSGQCDARLVSAVETLKESQPFLAVLGASGCGKGQAALDLADHIGTKLNKQCLLINGAFCFDTDTMLTEIRDFLDPPDPNTPAAQSRRQSFRSWDKTSPKNDEPIYVVINGMERFFSITGHPLSGELDEILGLRLRRLRWVLFSTERIRTYVVSRLKSDPRTFDELCASAQEIGALPFRQMEKIRLHILNQGLEPATLSPGDWRNVMAEARRFKALSAGRISGDAQGMREAFYSWALDDRVLAAVFPAQPDADRERIIVKRAQTLLRTLAFFGLPVEVAVLEASPAIRAARLTAADLDELLEALVDGGLVLRLGGHDFYDEPEPNQGPPRYALHRSLLTEMRRRFGIPLSEAKLSTAFNMSLYVAQPVDGYIPEPIIHDELGALVDRLIGAYREISGTAENAGEELETLARANGVDLATLRRYLDEASTVAASCAHSNSHIERLRIHQLCGRKSVQRLRAALGVIRGYYSTTGILTLDTGDRLIREDRDGILLEHAERLDRLIDAYAKMDLVRGTLRTRLSHQCFERLYGRAEPFHPEELVWLHNERGVVCLAMGDLYEARASFERAASVNRWQVEFEDRAHNWRRIRLNQLLVEIEMGDISLVRRMAEEILAVSKQRIELPETSDEELAVSDEMREEDCLASAIATGFLGWCSHLQGEFGRANAFYDEAIKQLENSEETRAHAFFLRLQVDALEPAKNHEAARSPIQRALDLAQSTRQMDLVYRIQISLAHAYFFKPGSTAEEKQLAHRMLDEALQYGLQADVHRVRCEASMTIARVRHAAGDFEGSLRFASDALMIASRYGMELRKIALRTDIARTMAIRGHPVTAQKLAQTAVRAASRQRFQTALDRAERVLIDIPQISAAIGTSDSSGRRNF